MSSGYSTPEIDPAHVVRFPAHPQAFDPSALPELDLSLVTYQSERWLAAFFASLVAQTYPLSLINLYVIDHSPYDACREAVERELSPIRKTLRSITVESRPNRGFGAGHNRTLALGHAPYVLVSNVDLTFAPDALVRLVTTATQDHHSAAWEARQKPYEHPKAYDPLTGATDWISGACVLLRRSAWAEVGGFDECFFMYGEDVDLSLRLRALGHGLRYCPQAVVWHHAYEEPGRLKEAQYFGSTLANSYLRLRFGSMRDVAIGLAMQAALLAHRAPVQHRLKKLFKNYRVLARNWKYFFRSPFSSSSAQAEDPSYSISKASERGTMGSPPEFTPDLDPGLGMKFRRWDYALHRRGAFVAAAELPDHPLVSIIVRTYPGRLPLLREALRSLDNQTWPKLEVIVVEDGGTTAPAELNAFPNLSIVYYPAPRRGRSNAGNIGLALAQGDYIGFLDDDDLLFADHVETVATALTANPAAPAVFAHAWEVETAFTHPGWKPYTEQLPRSRMRNGFDRAAFQSANYIPIQSVLFRHETYERHGGFCDSLDALEDWDVWLNFAQDGNFVHVDKTTSLYRIPANPDTRPQRMLALAAAYHAVRDRHPENRAAMPWHVTPWGQKILRRLTRFSGIYGLVRRLKQRLG